uniref:Uncharacterized protein n=1 Tax=uncultured marine virus TaxID=186617 RepID=A0A0F7L6Q0_9VIRU|nr:hypothetical protein [uncultured marine virus]
MASTPAASCSDSLRPSPVYSSKAHTLECRPRPSTATRMARCAPGLLPWSSPMPTGVPAGGTSSVTRWGPHALK